MAEKRQGDIWERSYGLKPESPKEAKRPERRLQAALDALGTHERRKAYLALTAAVAALFLAVLAAGAALTSAPGRDEPPEASPVAQDAAASGAEDDASAAPDAKQDGGGSGADSDSRLRFSGLDSLTFLTDGQIDSLCERARQYFVGAGFAEDEVIRALAIPGEEDCFWFAASSEATFAAVTPGQEGWDDAEISPCEKPERLSEYLDSRASAAPPVPGGSDAVPAEIGEAAYSALPAQAAEFLASRGEPCREEKTSALASTAKKTDAGCEVEVAAWLENGESRRLKASWDDASQTWSFEALQ